MASIIAQFFNRDKEYELVAFTVDKEYMYDSQFHGLKVIPFEDLPIKYPPTVVELFIAIGPTNMNKVRAKYFNLAKSKGYKMANFISKNAVVDSPLGENNFVGDLSVINPLVKIGDNNIIYDHCNILSCSKITDHCYLSPKSIIGTNSVVKRNSIIGMNAVIKTQITIAEETLIGAQCYIAKDTEYKGVYGVKSSQLLGCISDKIQMSMI